MLLVKITDKGLESYLKHEANLRGVPVQIMVKVLLLTMRELMEEETKRRLEGGDNKSIQ